MDLCLEAEQSLGTRVSKRLWYQEALYLEVMLTAAQEAEWEDSKGGRYKERSTGRWRIQITRPDENLSTIIP